MQIARLGPGDEHVARDVLAVVASVFAEDAGEVSLAYVTRLLARDDFWVLAASVDGVPVGGLTAHTLPMTRSEDSEIFLYDIAVLATHQRRGIGRALVAALREQAAALGVTCVFVPADDDDGHALDFYRALGGEPAPVTIFTFDK